MVHLELFTMSLDYFPPDVNTLTNGQSSIYSWGAKKAKDLLMWRIILTAVGSISLAGWTRLYSQPPGRLFVWAMWRIHIIHVLSSPDKDSISQRSPALHHVTPEHWSYWCSKWQHDGKIQNDRTAFSIPLWTQGCSCGLCLKTQQLFTPHSPMPCLFSWLTVFSLLQSFLYFAVPFHTSNI